MIKESQSSLQDIRVNMMSWSYSNFSKLCSMLFIFMSHVFFIGVHFSLDRCWELYKGAQAAPALLLVWQTLAKLLWHAQENGSCVRCWPEAVQSEYSHSIQADSSLATSRISVNRICFVRTKWSSALIGGEIWSMAGIRHATSQPRSLRAHRLW